MTNKNGFWSGPIDNIFLCMKCMKPILYNEKVISIDISERFKEGPLNTIGNSMYHEKCAKEVFGETMTKKQLFKYPNGIHE